MVVSIGFLVEIIYMKKSQLILLHGRGALFVEKNRVKTELSVSERGAQLKESDCWYVQLYNLPWAVFVQKLPLEAGALLHR